MEYSQNPKSSPFPIKQWWSKETVAVITGANKGIGFALVKRLAQLGLTVILTSRDPIKGQQALQSLRAQNLNHLLHYSQLDISDPQSISSFASWISHNFGGLDILVNNAGVSFNEIDTNSVEHAETVIKTNFYGPKLLIQSLLPLFRRSITASRILNISSQLGLLNKVKNPKLREMLANEENLSEEMIDQMVANFLWSVKKGTWKEEGWPEVWTDYSVSKLALNAHSRILARLHGNDDLLKINCFCPGFTRTAMTGGLGHRTADEAAELAASLVLLPHDQLPNGKFFKLSTPLLYSKL